MNNDCCQGVTLGKDILFARISIVCHKSYPGQKWVYSHVTLWLDQEGVVRVMEQPQSVDRTFKSASWSHQATSESATGHSEKYVYDTVDINVFTNEVIIF